MGFIARPMIDLRILLVEPDDDLRCVFPVLLELMGHTVEAASNAAEALERVSTFAPDVVLTELVLEGAGGLELAAQLRRLPSARDAALVAITSHVKSNSETIALEAGFDYFLAKPVTVEQVAVVLRSL